MKIYEFTGFRQYSCVIAAETEEAAQEKAKELGTNWIHYADVIGCNELEIDDIFEIRDLPDDCDPADYAHIIAEVKHESD